MCIRDRDVKYFKFGGMSGPPPPVAGPPASAPKWKREENQKPVVKTWQEKYPIHYNANIGNIEKLKEILEEFLTQNNPNITEYFSSKDDDGWAPLHYAAWYDQTEAVKFLINQGKADVNSVTEPNNSSVLHFAAGCGRVNVVVELLKDNVKIDVKDKEGQTPLKLCSDLKQNDWEKVIPLLTKSS
eukprot:TRINITY_DN14612_c0_g1_i1.p1 TRINITY_DN14612_c0_g1~~TRINITY_DN14612_c0_g1_i1.p1  ORF type:complete len:185 (+),score=50.51 TRINITY_DN14612_c0_g1_i1:27-581(+)